MKLIKFFYLFFISLILLSSLLFALLQTRWLKEKIIAQLKIACGEKGIDIEINSIEGVFPFSLQIDRFSCNFSQDLLLEGKELKLRLSPLSLLKKALLLSYVDIKEVKLLFSLSSTQTEPPGALPWRLLIRRLKIHELSCENRTTQKSATYTLQMQLDLAKEWSRLFLDMHLSPYETPHEVISLHLFGSKKRKNAALQLKTELSSLAPLAPFVSLPFIKEMHAESTLKGSWASFDAFLHKKRMLSPLSLRSHGTFLLSDLAPALNQVWHIDLDGDLNAYDTYSLHQLNLQSDLITLKAAGEINQQLAKSSFDAQLALLDLSALNDKLSGSAQATFHLAQARASLNMHSNAIELAHVEAKNIALHIEAAPALQGWEGKFALESQGKVPLDLSYAFHLNPFSTLTLSSLSMKSGPLFALGNLEFDLENKQIAGDLYTHLKEKASATLHLSHEDQKQRADLFLLGTGFTSSFELKEEEKGEYPFSLTIDKEGEEVFECQMQGRLNIEENRMALETEHLKGVYLSYPFSLNYPFIIEKTPFSLSLSHLDLEIGRGKLTAACDLNPVRSTGTFDLRDFPLEWLSTLFPQRALTGTLSTSAFFEATSDAIKGNLNAIFDREGTFPVKGSLQAHLDHHIIQAHAYLMASQEQYAEMSASLPFTYHLYPFNISLNPEQNLSGECMIHARMQDLFDFLNFGAHQFTGFLSSRLLFAGTLKTPIVQGELFWEEGSYDNYLTGTALKNIQAELRAEKDQIHLLALSANDGKKGEIEAQGSLNLDLSRDLPYHVTAELKELHTLHFNPIDCTLTGTLYVQGTTKEAHVQGNLLIDESKYTLNDTRASEIPLLPITLLNIPSASSEAVINSHPFPLYLDLNLTADERIMVVGKGLTSEWKGSLHLTGENSNIHTSGTLDLVKGEYDLLGKTFKLTEGEIVFSEKLGVAARIQLTGLLSLPESQITAHLRGPLSAPTLTLQSNPQMSTSAILARVLFNKEISDISQPEALQIATALISLSGGAGPSVLEAIRKNLGVDRLAIVSQANNPNEIAVQIGKYLTKGVMITLSQSATSSQIIIEVEFKHGFVFRAETQDVEEGKFSFKWTHSY